MGNLATFQRSQSANNIISGTVTIGTTAVQFDSSTAETYKNVLGVELETTATVYRGDSNITTANGITVVANVPNFVPLRDLTKLYLLATVAGQTVKYLIYT